MTFGSGGWSLKLGVLGFACEVSMYVWKRGARLRLDGGLLYMFSLVYLFVYGENVPVGEGYIRFLSLGNLSLFCAHACKKRGKESRLILTNL